MGNVTPSTSLMSNYSSGHDNNFNLIRLLAAFAVLFSHSYSVVFGSANPYRPLFEATGAPLGSHAVNIFFVISGLLVMQSWDRSSSPLSFVTARIMRIYPAMIVYAILVVFIIGAAFSSVDLLAYYTSAEAWTYLFSVGSLIEPDKTLPGLFATNPDAYNVNASLWTLRYELICYGALVVAGMLGAFKSRTRFGFLALITAIILFGFSQTSIGADMHAPFRGLVRFGFCFGIGVAAYHFRDKIPLHWSMLVVAGFAVYAAVGTPLYAFTLYVAVGYTTLWLAYIPNGPIRLFNKTGDYSYGVYIYAYPIQQTIVATSPDLSPVEVFMSAGLLTLLAAIASWHVIEQPALRSKSAVALWLSKKMDRRSQQDSNLQRPA